MKRCSRYLQDVRLTALSVVAVLTISMLFGGIPGCDRGSTDAIPSAQIEKYRQVYLRSEIEEMEAIGVQEAYRKLQAGVEKPEEVSEPQEFRVALQGRIGGMPNPLPDTQPDFPWRPGEAAFYLVDLAKVEEFAAHEEQAGPDHKNCPFCARAAAQSLDSVAAVTFNDASGKVLKLDARQLFDLRERDKVTVFGKADLVGGNLLVVEAEGFYVER